MSQATATLSDGRVFVIGGSWNGGTGGKDGEVRRGTHHAPLQGPQPWPATTGAWSTFLSAASMDWLVVPGALRAVAIRLIACCNSCIVHLQMVLQMPAAQQKLYPESGCHRATPRRAVITRPQG